MEDVAIVKFLKQKIQVVPVTIKTSAFKYKRDGWLKRSINNITLLIRFKVGADPRELAKLYYRN